MGDLVRGRCRGCGRGGLMVGEEGHVTCSHMDCPDPTSTDEWLRVGPKPPSVDGFCPFGCGGTLVVRVGRISCDGQSCPHPLAVHEILADRETEHLVEIRWDSFGLQHPLRERINGDLFKCEIYSTIHASDGPPVAPGFYRTRDGMTFDVLHAEAVVGDRDADLEHEGASDDDD